MSPNFFWLTNAVHIPVVPDSNPDPTRFILRFVFVAYHIPPHTIPFFNHSENHNFTLYGVHKKLNKARRNCYVLLSPNLPATRSTTQQKARLCEISSIAVPRLRAIANLWLPVSQRAYKRLNVNVLPSRPASSNSGTLLHT
jgi:hypothetical protein